MARSIVRRVEDGDEVEIPGLSLKGKHKDLPLIETQNLDDFVGTESQRLTTSDAPEWTEIRASIYRENRGLFLVHELDATAETGQRFDVAIFLIAHKSDAIKSVRSTEFFLGPFWGNMVFAGDNTGNYIGIRTLAYGPFLCVCRVTFDDGVSVILQRYIDFEMAEKLKREGT